MIDDFLVEQVTKIANARISRDYPMMKNPFKVGNVKYICEAMLDLSTEIIRREDEIQRGK